MFKSSTPFALDVPDGADLLQLLSIDACMLASPTSAVQPRTVGLVAPHPQEPDVLAHPVGRAGMVMLCMQTETRTAPAALLRERVEQQCKQLERATGPKPGRAQRREITEHIRLDMLGAAFPRKRRTLILLAPQAGLVLIEGTSNATFDDALTLLAGLLPKAFGIAVYPLRTLLSTDAELEAWALRGCPDGLELGQRLALHGPEGEAVSYADLDLERAADEIDHHISTDRYSVSRLEITWRRRVSFVIDPALRLRRVRLLDTPDDIDPSDAADDWSSTALITASELTACVRSLVDDHFGGLA